MNSPVSFGATGAVVGASGEATGSDPAAMEVIFSSVELELLSSSS